MKITILQEFFNLKLLVYSVLSLMVFFFIIGSNKCYGQGFIYAGVEQEGSYRGEIRDLVNDPSGNSYSTGWSEAKLLNSPPDERTNNVFVTKRNSSGEVLWRKRASSSIQAGSSVGNSITIDESENLYVTGVFYGTVEFNPMGTPSYTYTADDHGDIFILKYSNNGNLLWACAMGGNSEDSGNGIVVDNNGNVYTIGRFASQADFDPGTNSFYIDSYEYGGGTGTFISKLDSDGNFIYAKSFLGHGLGSNINCGAIEIDENNNIYIAGLLSGYVDFDPGVNQYILHASSYGSEASVTKLDSDGNLIWSKSTYGTGYVSKAGAYGIAIDQLGCVYLTGSFCNTIDFDPGGGVYQMTPYPNNQENIFVWKLTNNGEYLWAKAFKGTEWVPLDGRGNALCIGNDGGVFVAGYFSNSFDFDPGPEEFILNTNLGDDGFIVKLDSYGNLIWVVPLDACNSGNWCTINSITSFSDDIIYIGGDYQGTVDFDPGASTSYMSTVYGISSFIGIYNLMVDDFIWTGTIDEYWNNSQNWSSGQLPGTIDNVIIPNILNKPKILPGESAFCHDLLIEENSSLTIEGTVLGTGELLTTGTITNYGEINLKRTISNGQWHLISSPIVSATAISFYGKFLQSWNEVSHSWVEITEPGTNLDATTGYLLWGTGSGSTTYTFAGTPLTGNQFKSLTYTNNGSGNQGANLVGNPYPSTIDWDLLRGTYGAVYYLDNGSYKSWNGTGDGSRYITPMQGFFVITGNGGATLCLTNGHRTHTSATNFYKQSMASDVVVLETVSPDGYSDKLYLRFDQEAQSGFELPRDAWKLPSFAEGVSQLWSVDPEGGRLSIDVRPATESIPVGFSNTVNGTYSIGVAQPGNQPALYLEDTQTGTIHNFANGAYSFNYTLTDNPNRFKLLFGAIGTPETANAPIRQWITGHTLYISAPELTGQQAEVTVYSLTGQAQQRQRVTLGEITSVELQTPSGAVMVETISLDGSRVLTTKGVIIK